MRTSSPTLHAYLDRRAANDQGRPYLKYTSEKTISGAPMYILNLQGQLSGWGVNQWPQIIFLLF